MPGGSCEKLGPNFLKDSSLCIKRYLFFYLHGVFVGAGTTKERKETKKKTQKVRGREKKQKQKIERQTNKQTNNKHTNKQ
jgi:hypothetical protein